MIFLLNGYLVFRLMIWYEIMGFSLWLIQHDGTCLVDGSSNADVHILIVSPKHASLILCIFAKECQRGRLLEI